MLTRVVRVVIQIPNEVTDYYLQRVGFESDDVRLSVLPIKLLLFSLSDTQVTHRSCFAENACYRSPRRNSYQTLQLKPFSTPDYEQMPSVVGESRLIKTLKEGARQPRR